MFFTTCLTSLVWCKRVKLWSWGVKASAYTLPNMGPYPECKSGPLAFHGWSPSGSMWQPLKLRCQCQDDSRWFKMIQDELRSFKHLSTSFNMSQSAINHLSFLRSHLSSVPNCCTFDTPSTTPSTPAPRGPGRMRSVSLRCRLRRSARAWTPGWRWWWGHPARGRRIPQCRQGQDMAGRWDLGSEEIGHVQIDTDWDSHHLETWSDFES